MKLVEALDLAVKACAAGWLNVTVGPEDPHLNDRDDCFVVGIDPKDKQRKRYEPAAAAPVEAKAPEPSPVEAPAPAAEVK